MEHLRMENIDMTKENVQKIAALFPNCVTEHKDEKGNIVLGIDFEKLKIELGDDIIGENEERYQFTWPDKKKAIREANTATTSTLRPCPEESVDFENTKNLYIEGDNLEVLKCLRETYLGKVKMIYIDPPYNTGNDFVYNDDFAMDANEYIEKSGQKDTEGDRLFRNTESNGRFHTDWLNMMYPRLKVARDLLSEDGVIFISIDDNEVENLKKICDEVFGQNNFIGQWNWFKSATPPALSKKIKKNLEYIISFQKGNNNDVFSGIKKTSSSNDPITKPQNTYKNLFFPSGSISTKLTDGVYSKGIYGTDKFPNELLNDLVVRDGKNVNDVTFRNRFIWIQSTLDEQLANGTKIELSKQLVLSYKKADYNKEVPPSLIDIQVGVDTTENAGRYLTDLFNGIDVFDYPKPTSLIHYLTNFFIKGNSESIIIDFFSGSATTAHAVMQLNAEDQGNRKFIMVQLPELTDEKSEAYKAGYKNICEIGKERIRRAGKEIKKEHPEAKDFDTGFRVLKLDSSNMEDVYYTPSTTHVSLFSQENIKEDRNDLDLLFQVMLESNVELSEKIETKKIEGKNVYFVKDNYLVACFDENVTEKVITAIAKEKPYYFVMRDSSLDSDNVADNFEQIFRTYSPDTIRKIL